jgi:hypothetical protein
MERRVSGEGQGRGGWAGGVVLAVLKRLGNYRLGRLFHEARKRDPTFVDGALEYLLNAEAPERPLRVAFLQRYLGGELPMDQALLELDAEASLEKQLDAIPSETSPAERRFLWSFMANVWSGGRDVLEVGPFLGGTTRALALGMMANPRADKERLLHTFDRFSGYHSRESLLGLTRPLVERGLLTGADLDHLGDRVSFREIFDALHARQPYGSMLRVHDRPLPDTAEQATGAGEWFRLPEGAEFEVFFVDGCKSWFGTKYFMMECCREARPGSHFIFQDFSHFTCFWLPAFIETFREYFRQIAHVETTYAFALVRALPPDEVRARFPDRPEDWTEAAFDALFGSVVARARTRRDRAACVRHAMHGAAALAYLGNKDEALRRLKALRESPEASDLRGIVDLALKSPTYRPDGKVMLEG